MSSFNQEYHYTMQLFFVCVRETDTYVVTCELDQQCHFVQGGREESVGTSARQVAVWSGSVAVPSLHLDVSRERATFFFPRIGRATLGASGPTD
jgi:hypothetical protein